MNRPRHQRWLTPLILLGLLLSGLALPNSAPATQAAPPSDSGDAQLVRPSVQHPIQDSVFYFVMPDRFGNGDTANDSGGIAGGPTSSGFLPSDKGYYHGGDIQGLRSKLDYLQGLGISAIWMTPIFKNKPLQNDPSGFGGFSAGYHGYWITDFTQVDPHMGSNADLTALIADAHGRGMKVFFDIITNHTADVIDYEGGQHGYRNKTNFPYKDASGNVFDDADYAGTNSFPALDPNVSFPYKPIFNNPADATAKKPDWLNNPIFYHNRGDSTFSGENSLYGDFFGLDDLFTEQPAVAQGMTDIYKTWIKDFGIDGYRIDTVKHVNIEFWQKFGPEIQAYAKANGKPDFFMYGEVFDSDPAFMSQYTTAGKLPATLDFGFQSNATGFAKGGATDQLAAFFAKDDYYTDADSNAYSLPTFLGNHDMGRIGRFLNNDSSTITPANAATLLQRDKLAHALMFTARGMPVIYYGDEQGFTGDGGDKDARQDMFPSLVASYNDDNLIGSDSTTAVANYDPNHPLYQAIKTLSDIRNANKALRRGAQIQRYSGGAAGIYAFSRIDRDEKIEYIVALNNAATAQTATFKTYLPNTKYAAVYPAGAAALTTSAQADLTVDVPALSFAIYKATRPLPALKTVPGITISAPAQNQPVTGRVEVAAQLEADRFAEVTFAVKVGGAPNYTVIGTDNNAPYRVFYDVGALPAGTDLSFKAIVNDVTDDTGGTIGKLNSATVGAIVGVTDSSCAANPDYAIVHYRRPAGDYDGWGLHLWGDAIDPSEVTADWNSPKLPNGEDAYGVFWYIKLQDASQPVNFIVHKGDEKDGTTADRRFDPGSTPQIWLKQSDANNYTSQAAAQGFVTVHYKRSAGDYADWGLHLWGDAIADGVGTDWAAPRQRDGIDDYGAFYNIPLKDVGQPVNFIMHRPSGDSVPDTREPGGDRSFLPQTTADIWLVQGDPAVYTTRGAVHAVATPPAIASPHRCRPQSA
ncbi:MAG TPA: alpha-amylase family glycosyl hydrolase [Roseiflexaceae bacterium]|nr:alpha-amylase family glycosyl hydrolase [Roseiflexaceae bacterium]